MLNNNSNDYDDNNSNCHFLDSKGVRRFAKMATVFPPVPALHTPWNKTLQSLLSEVASLSPALESGLGLWLALVNRLYVEMTLSKCQSLGLKRPIASALALLECCWRPPCKEVQTSLLVEERPPGKIGPTIPAVAAVPVEAPDRWEWLSQNTQSQPSLQLPSATWVNPGQTMEVLWTQPQISWDGNHCCFKLLHVGMDFLQLQITEILSMD